MIKVSVIIPIYGVEKYIEKCARSVFEQTYSDLEVIFVDDCTPDNSIAILKQVLEEYPLMKDKTQILSYPKNRGLAGARKFGLEVAHGDYLLQIDSDDYIARDMVEAMVAKAKENNADVVICDFNMIQDGKESHLHVNPSLDHIACLKQVLTGEVHGAVWNKLIRRSLYTDNDITPIQGLNMREDLSVMYRLLYFAKEIAYIPQPFYNYVLRDGSLTSFLMNFKSQQNSEDLVRCMDAFCQIQKIKDVSLINAFNIFKANVKSSILLHGDVNRMDFSLYKDLKMKHYLHLSRPQMLIGLISSLRCKILFLFCRKIADLKYKR